MPDIEPCIWYFSSFLRRFGDIQCMDCGSRSDRRTCRLLRQADLVVIIVRQSRAEFCRIFCGNRINFPNCVWLIRDYIPGIAPDIDGILFEFRIPSSRLACVPYSPHLRNTKKIPGTGSLSPDIRRDLNRAGHIMLIALGF